MGKVLGAVAPLVARHYVVMEVKNNLVKDERATLLKRFSAPHFQRVAHVAIGEPAAAYKTWVHGSILSQKQVAARKAREDRKVEKLKNAQLKEQSDKRKQTE